VKTRRQELLKLIEQGLRQKKLSFATTNGSVHWPIPTYSDRLTWSCD